MDKFDLSTLVPLVVAVSVAIVVFTALYMSSPPSKK